VPNGQLLHAFRLIACHNWPLDVREVGEQFAPVGLSAGREIPAVRTGKILGEQTHPNELTENV
jgi:hypothetical protein